MDQRLRASGAPWTVRTLPTPPWTVRTFFSTTLLPTSALCIGASVLRFPASLRALLTQRLQLLGVGLKAKVQAGEPEAAVQVHLADARLGGNQLAQLLGQEQVVHAVQDGREAHGLPPQGGREDVDVAQLRHQDLLLLQVLASRPLGLQAAGGQRPPLLVHVAGRQQVEAGGGVVDVQQRLVGGGQCQAVLGGVVGGEGLVQLRGGEGAEGTEVHADLRHVEVLRLVDVAVGGHDHRVLKQFSLEAEGVAVAFEDVAALDNRLAVDLLHEAPLDVQPP